jgi:hypothetical protein
MRNHNKTRENEKMRKDLIIIAIIGSILVVFAMLLVFSPKEKEDSLNVVEPEFAEIWKGNINDSVPVDSGVLLVSRIDLNRP